jgi:signal transduction histidine kinase
MAGMSKLLNKPFRAFTIYALVILACSIPVYYWVVDRIWIHELDERNAIIKEMVAEGAKKVKFNEAKIDDLLILWNTIQPGTTLTASQNGFEKDSFYTAIRKTSEEADRLRGLASSIVINDKYYRLTVETNIEEADETIAAISILTIFFFILLAVGFIFLNKRISKKIWRPFTRTLQRLQSFDLTKDRNLYLEETGIEEFQQLNKTLDKLIQQNISVYRQQKVFIENASHELQTPLALLKSKMDMLLQNKDITTEQLQILETIERPVSRMSRINKNLLLLAKIESSQYADVTEADVSLVLNDSIKLLQDYIDDKDLQIVYEKSESLLVSCNPFLLETLINNLLTNCIRHTDVSGKITIELMNNQLLFKNSGNEPLKEKGLFERFAVSSAKTTSSGLGLAIVKEICNRYQWQVSYSFVNNLHCFGIRFV